jgi:hypothetical protein
MVADVFRAAEPVIPAGLERWTGAVQQYPVEFALLALAFAGSYQLGSWLRGQLCDFKMLAWHAQLRRPYRDALLQTEAKRIKLTLKLLVVFDAIFVLLLLAPGIQAGTPGTWTLAVLVNLLAGVRLGWHRRFQRVLADPERPISEGNFNQLVAHKMRTSTFMQALSFNLRKRVVPVLFGLGIVYAGLIALNRTAFDLESSSGAFCASSRHDGQHLPTVTGRVNASSVFSTDQLCSPSGWRLAARTRYRVTLTQQENWVDRTTPTGIRGFEADSFAHWTGTPLKRWWGEPWFAPIVHVGVKGNEEFPLRPCRGGIADQPNVLVAEFTTVHDGELFLFVNDAVVAVPPFQRHFYDNNHGTATVQIEPVHDDAKTASYSCPD